MAVLKEDPIAGPFAFLDHSGSDLLLTLSQTRR